MTARSRRDVSSTDTFYWPVFFYSSLGFIFFNVGAQLYLVEVLALLVCFHALLSKKPVGLPLALMVSLVLWLFGTMLSDIWNASPAGEAMKGLARVATLLILLVAIYYLLDNRVGRAVALWIGLAASLLLGLVLAPNGYFAGEPWKFGLAQPITLLGFIAASTVLRRFGLSIAVVLSAVNFLMGSRSIAIICLLSALVLVIRHRKEKRTGTARVVTVAFVGLAAAASVVVLYDQLALSGVFGDARRMRADYQSSGNLGAFVTGRGEIFFSLRSIAEHPLFGVGSYALPDQSVINAQVQFLIAEGYGSVATNYRNEGISSFHSEIFGAVAENGLLALPFWIGVGSIFVYGISTVVRGAAAKPQLVTFICVFGLWDLAFSPFGADRKFWVAASIATVLVLCKRGVSSESVRGDDQLQSRAVSYAQPRQRRGAGR